MSCFVVNDIVIVKAIRPLVDAAWDRYPCAALGRHLAGLAVKNEDGVLERLDLTRQIHRENLYARMKQANEEAYAGRYGDEMEQPFPVNDRGYYAGRAGEMATDVESYKALQCWLYQCSERGLSPASLDLLGRMSKVLADLARIIVEHLPEYDKAKWGE